MIFRNSNRSKEQTIDIKIEGELLDVVTHTKFLGIVVDNSLSWKLHLDYISKKIAKSVGIISRARQQTTLLFLSLSLSHVLHYYLGLSL